MLKMYLVVYTILKLIDQLIVSNKMIRDQVKVTVARKCSVTHHTHRPIAAQVECSYIVGRTVRDTCASVHRDCILRYCYVPFHL